MAEYPAIVAARRSPIATRGRALARLTVDQLAAPVLRATIRDGFEALGSTRSLGDVVLGNCMGPGGNPARTSALAAGIDPAVPGLTLDRQCGSGLAAILVAADAIGAGDDRPRVAGGVESASTAPVRSVDGIPYDRAPFTPAGSPDPDMAQAAEDLAGIIGIARAEQDAHAAQSHRRAVAAAERGAFRDELVRYADLALDDAAGSVTPRTLARFTPLFQAGTLTGGNSCRISDGAAAVLLAPASSRGGAPALLLRAQATVGCDPALPGLGAAFAIEAALERAGATLAQISAFEVVEAFAAQTLAVLGKLGLAATDARVCADGGALALGHPWGASGAVSVVRLFSRLVRGDAPDGILGVAAASIGGGMGVAAVFEVRR